MEMNDYILTQRMCLVRLQMAQYIIPPVTAASTTPALPDQANDGNPTVIPTEALLSPDVEHAFLIRTPEKAVPSEQ